MADPQAEALRRIPRRVFLNCLDSHSSRNIAQFLCACVVGAADEEERDEEEEAAHPDRAAAFQVVGTVSGPSNGDRPHVHEEYFLPGRAELLSKLMECHVVIYNISQDAEQVEEATWAVTALHNQIESFSGPKLFILVSTVMTWASSKPLDPNDPELPFTDEIFWSRRAHPSFQQHIDLEKRVVKIGKSNRALLSTYVVASGLQYGMGEHIFHHFFKKSWLGQDRRISVFGDGQNIVPTIHICDLARVLWNVIEHQPQPYYLLAVDSSNNRMEEIVKAIASALGPAKIQKRPFEEIYLIKDMSAMEIDFLQVNLRMEAVHIKKLFSISWLSEFGLVDNVELVVEEYRQNRGLLPLRLCVLGPPAVGKSTVSRRICERYKLHHIRLKDAVSEAVAQLEEFVKNSDPDVDDKAAEAQDLLTRLKDREENNFEEQLKVLKDKLMSNPCRNQGFVLDDFPSTYEEAKELFSEDSEGLPSNSRRIMPEFVLCLDASDSFLRERVISLPERLVQELDYEPEHFLRRLAAYRESSAEEESVLNYFVELDIPPLHLNATSSEEQDCWLLMQKIFDTVGPPRTYGPDSQEVEEEERRKAEEELRREAEQRAKEEQTEEEEARSRATRWKDWTQSLEAERQQEEQQLEEQTVLMRGYLMEHVMPTLTRGLLECCRTQPPNPVEFLAEFLFKNNPFDYPK
ncbi:adenylate kinase 7 isoform X2 [Kryptolebias marmoratus]|uniref:adenylate kinase 7 isoform X2 n=1 Tax=Kryptolebias marmoratus TaxID=37003 RepID=UPI0007F925F6|nr:adenylate kinase 7 isoform X2 [Kryptolebias marmoratus]